MTFTRSSPWTAATVGAGGPAGCAEIAWLRRERGAGQAEDAVDGAVGPDLLMLGRALLRWTVAALEDPTLSVPSVSLLVAVIQRLRQASGRAPLCPAALRSLCGSPGEESIELLALSLAEAWLGARARSSLW